VRDFIRIIDTLKKEEKTISTNREGKEGVFLKGGWVRGSRGENSPYSKRKRMAPYVQSDGEVNERYESSRWDVNRHWNGEG